VSKKLFTVEVTVHFDMVVWAENSTEAESIADRSAMRELNNQRPQIITSAVGNEIPDEWMNAIPWGTEGDATVAEILAKGAKK
jgi:hypothetical protein